MSLVYKPSKGDHVRVHVGDHAYSCRVSDAGPLTYEVTHVHGRYWIFSVFGHGCLNEADVTIELIMKATLWDSRHIDGSYYRGRRIDYIESFFNNSNWREALSDLSVDALDQFVRHLWHDEVKKAPKQSSWIRSLAQKVKEP